MDQHYYLLHYLLVYFHQNYYLIENHRMDCYQTVMLDFAKEHYFLAQSRGMFDPTFDVAAKVTLNKSYAYYGKNGYRIDLNVTSMIREAVNDAISQGVDFSKYYVNGKVPNIIVYYAGCGEATGGDENTIWPHEMDYSTSYGTKYSYHCKMFNR